MLRLVDLLIRDLLVEDLALITSDTQVRFQPPDPTWRTAVTNLNRMALSVYLVDLRTNRKLHTSAREVAVDHGFVYSEPAPERVDCHYLISAWSPTPAGGMIEPVLDEHALLYDAAAALMHRTPFNPSDLYAAGSLKLTAWPERFQDQPLPTQVLPAEGFPKLAEFWNGMADVRWHPAIYLIVTIPVALLRSMSGALVTTTMTGYRVTNHPEMTEIWLQIGGVVLDVTSPPLELPIPGAWVRLETPGGDLLQVAETNELGRFTFERLRERQYRLRTGAPGIGAGQRLVTVPSESGEYDVRIP